MPAHQHRVAPHRPQVDWQPRGGRGRRLDAAGRLADRIEAALTSAAAAAAGADRVLVFAIAAGPALVPAEEAAAGERAAADADEDAGETTAGFRVLRVGLPAARAAAIEREATARVGGRPVRVSELRRTTAAHRCLEEEVASPFSGGGVRSRAFAEFPCGALEVYGDGVALLVCDGVQRSDRATEPPFPCASDRRHLTEEIRRTRFDFEGGGGQGAAARNAVTLALEEAVVTGGAAVELMARPMTEASAASTTTARRASLEVRAGASRGAVYRACRSLLATA